MLYKIFYEDSLDETDDCDTCLQLYNRREYLEITAKSLYACSNINKATVKIFNDCSPEDEYLFFRFNIC